MRVGPAYDSSRLQRVFTALACANADDFFYRRYEYLAVTNMAGSRNAHQSLDYVFGHFVLDDDLNSHLGNEINDIGGAAVDFLLSTGSSEAFDFGNCHSLDPDFAQAILYVIELERFDNGFDLFHDAPVRKIKRA